MKVMKMAWQYSMANVCNNNENSSNINNEK